MVSDEEMSLAGVQEAVLFWTTEYVDQEKSRMDIRKLKTTRSKTSQTPKAYLNKE